MEETNGLPPTTFGRSDSGVSRFNEHFSDSSGSSLPVCIQPHQIGHPHHIIQRLMVERKRQLNHLKSITHKPCKTRETLGQKGSRRLSTATALAYQRQRSIAQQMVDEHRHAKRARKKREKQHKRKSQLSGTVWGYDPMAGRVSETYNASAAHHHVHGCYIFKGPRNESDEYGVAKIDSLGRRTGRQWLQGSKWGIECGGPGREPQFECSHLMQGQEENVADLLRRR